MRFDNMAQQNIISYHGNLETVLIDVTNEYNLGDYLSFVCIDIGYEDYNVTLKTSLGTYFVKIFASYKQTDEINRNVEILEAVSSQGIHIPKLFYHGNSLLFSRKYPEGDINLIVQEFLPVNDLWSDNVSLTNEDKVALAKVAAQISKIRIDECPIFDQWSILNIINFYQEVSPQCSESDRALLQPIIDKIKKLDFRQFPHSFIHGDLTRTNLIKYNGQIYIIDFSVANHAPRIQELAILLANTVFDPFHPTDIEKDYNLVLNTYSELVPLTEKEIETLPLYIKAAYATNILGITKMISVGKSVEENKYWLELGRKGIEMMNSITL